MEAIKEIAAQIATPSYVFDIDEFHHRVALVKEAFGEKTGICFSIKANPFLLPYLPASFDKIEVCSPGELTICEKTGVDMGKIIFSGVNKTQADVDRAMDDGVGVFTAESYLHLQQIDAAARKRGLCVPVLIRLTAGSQFGMDEKDVRAIIEHRQDYPGVSIIGLHYFSGTQKRKIALIEKELDYALSFVQDVERDYGFVLEHLEYGTGLAVDYFSADADALEQARLDAVSVKIREVSQKIKLTVEMGRFFAAPCGYYFTRVMDTKTNMDVNYAIVDGGLNQLKYDGQIQGMQIPVISHIPGAESANNATEKWTLCGSLCTTADVLTKNVELTGLSIGDILVFHRTGAYSVMEGMAVFLSREMPEVYVHSQASGLIKIRRMLWTDVFNTPMALV